MPYSEKELDDLPRCVETGQIALTELLNRLFLDPKVLEEHPHWSTFQEVGHLQELDAECVKVMGLSEGLLEHLGHYWPPRGLDLAHVAIVNAVLDGIPIRFSWGPATGSEASVSVGDTGAVLNVKIFSPVPVEAAAREPVEALA